MRRKVRRSFLFLLAASLSSGNAVGCATASDGLHTPPRGPERLIATNQPTDGPAHRVEEGLVVSPKSGPDGLNPCITLDANTMTTQFTVWTMPKGPFLVWKQSKPS